MESNYALPLTRVPVTKIGGAQGYSGNDNRTFCEENGIETSFTQKGRTYVEHDFTGMEVHLMF